MPCLQPKGLGLNKVTCYKPEEGGVMEGEAVFQKSQPRFPPPALQIE